LDLAGAGRVRLVDSEIGYRPVPNFVAKASPTAFRHETALPIGAPVAPVLRRAQQSSVLTLRSRGTVGPSPRAASLRSDRRDGKKQRPGKWRERYRTALRLSRAIRQGRADKRGRRRGQGTLKSTVPATCPQALGNRPGDLRIPDSPAVRLPPVVRLAAPIDVTRPRPRDHYESVRPAFSRMYPFCSPARCGFACFIRAVSRFRQARSIQRPSSPFPRPLPITGRIQDASSAATDRRQKTSRRRQEGSLTRSGRPEGYRASEDGELKQMIGLKAELLRRREMVVDLLRHAGIAAWRTLSQTVPNCLIAII